MNSDLKTIIENPDIFVEGMLYIVDQDRKKVRFKMNPPQRKYYQERTNADLILKSRKEGFSSLIEALFLHACIFEENVNAVTMSHTWDDTVIHLDRVKYYLETMGYGNIKFEVPLDKENQRELYFPHSHSRYWIGTAGSKAFGRGRDITHLHLSEVAHYENQDVLTSAIEACVPNAVKIMETTANGTGGPFYHQWVKAKLGATGWAQHFFAWFDDPRSVASHCVSVHGPQDIEFKKKYRLTTEQLNWYINKRESMLDPSKMPQEYPSDDQEAFLAAGECVFDRRGMEALSVTLTDPIKRGFVRDAGEDGVEFVPDESAGLVIWDYPRDQARYLICADVAKGGEKGDSSAALVFDGFRREVVARWHGKVDTFEFARILAGIGYYYNTATLAVEVWPGPGIATGEKLVEMGYPNIYRRTEWDGERRISREEIGWKTNEGSRYEALATCQNWVRQNKFTLHDALTVGEMATFVRNKRTGKMEAQAGCHDDTVICLAMASAILEHEPIGNTFRERNNRHVIATGGVRLPGQERKKANGQARRGALAGFA